MDAEQFQRLLQNKGIEITAPQMQQFEHFVQLIGEWNQKMNLTAITEPEEMYVKHFYDSLTVALYVDMSAVTSTVDVGAGAGFPGIPLAIVFPHVRFTLVDSLQKRTRFLQHVVGALQLENVQIFHNRAETFARLPEHRATYDMAVARAVARMNVLAELCLPLVRKNGQFIAMKGSKGKEESVTAQGAIACLGGEARTPFTFSLPEGGGERHIIVVDKVQATPRKYPRKPGMPNKKPLV
jgi:16S rRNA (guanine527-N7)-methyltransferase